MSFTDRISTILKTATGYRLFVRIVGGNACRKYLAEYVKPVSGEKVLDIGCGPGDIVNFLSDVDYTGFDISPEYIDSARKRYGTKGRFYCSDVGLEKIEKEQGSFDLVLATGVLHHLNDETAARLFELARLAMTPRGRLITFDGCYAPGQSRIARWIIGKDRGKFVRPDHEYTRLASAAFSRVESYLRHDLLRVPYTHLIMRCGN